MRQSLGKCRRSPAFVISLLALFIALTGVGDAATGGSLILGRHNIASRVTALSSKAGPSLALTNTGGKPAASFHVLAGKPPFAVNSSTKVSGLNADLLDGIDSSAFQLRVQPCLAVGSAISEIEADGNVVCSSGLTGTWNRTGNTGTDPSADFLGTTDAEPLIFKTNDTEVMRISANGNLGVGTNNPATLFEAVSSGSGDSIRGVTTSGVAVEGQSTSGDAVHGFSDSNDGVAGSSTSGIGIVGATTTGTAGVLGEGPNDGVRGTSTHASGGATAAAVDAITPPEATSSSDRPALACTWLVSTRAARATSTAAPRPPAPTMRSRCRSASTQELAPGDVLAVDPNHANEVRLSASSDSQLVVGVYSTKPSVLATGNRGIDDSLAGTVPVAMLGIVPTKVSAENGAVKAGDLLTTARTPGYAMKAASVVVDG